jgi:serine/threonine-protein kinase RsbW
MRSSPKLCDMQADRRIGPEAVPQGARTRLVFPADNLAVRSGLQSLFARMPLADLSQDTRGSVEIVLGEALNNIVEHAYVSGTGEIEISLWLESPDLVVQITDFGAAMPGGDLPKGRLAAHGTLETLPEGGFGWHLIRELATDLHYRREGEMNLLSFRMAAVQSAQ